MTVAGKVGICDLLPEFLADAFGVLGPFQAAGTISAGALQAIPDGLDHFLIFIQPNSHKHILLVFFSLYPCFRSCQGERGVVNA